MLKKLHSDRFRVLFAALLFPSLIAGCSDAPSDRAVEAGLDQVARGAYETRRIFVTHEKDRRISGVFAAEEGLYITTYQVTKPRRDARIFLNREEIYRGPEETIGQPFAYGDSVFMPNEHGTHVLKSTKGHMSFAAPAKGRWSVLGGVVKDRPVVAFNDSYRHKRFSDGAIFYDAETGSELWKTGVKGMPRSIVEYDNTVWISHNFGENVVINRRGERIEGDVVSLSVFDKKMYGGGGARVGRSKKASDKNGTIYVLEAGQWRELFDTGCWSIPQMLVIEDKLWIVGQNPNRVFRMDPGGQFELVAEAETFDKKNTGTFGSAITSYDGRVFWAHSSLDRGFVDEILLP